MTQTQESLQRRIATVQDLGAVVRTMKALSGATIRQYENAAAAVGEYYRTVELGLRAVLHGVPLPRLPHRPPDAAVGVIVIGSDHGLCGRFNELIVQHVVDELKQLPPAPHYALAVGAQVQMRLDELQCPVTLSLPTPGSVTAMTRTVEQLLLEIDRWRSQEKVFEVLLVHHSPTGRSLYRAQSMRLLPVDFRHFRPLGEQPWPGRSLPYFSQDRAALLAALIRQYFLVVLFRACAESLACEHAARLAVMQRADKNIAEHLQVLNNQYRQQRQSAITEELQDIIAGGLYLD
ncbi:MAG: F0F1 ATP synthase subunit gamma [Gammaproteobacteria bacterium]